MEKYIVQPLTTVKKRKVISRKRPQYNINKMNFMDIAWFLVKRHQVFLLSLAVLLEFTWIILRSM